MRRVTTLIRRPISVPDLAGCDKALYCEHVQLVTQTANRDLQSLGGMSAIPAASLQHFYDMVALDLS